MTTPLQPKPGDLICPECGGSTPAGLDPAFSHTEDCSFHADRVDPDFPETPDFTVVPEPEPTMTVTLPVSTWETVCDVLRERGFQTTETLDALQAILGFPSRADMLDALPDLPR